MSRERGPLHALLGLCAVLACTASWVGAVAGSGVAAPGESVGPALPGKRIAAASVAAKAPEVGTGRYLVAMPTRGTTYVAVRRSAPGTTLHVGAQLVGRGGSVGEGLDVELGTSPGKDDCGSAVVFRPTLGQHAPVLVASVSSWTSVADHPCTTSDRLYLGIRPPTDPRDAGRLLQLRVYEEPPLDESSFSLLTTPSPSVWSELEPGVAQPVEAGRDVDDAPEVHDGTYALTVRPGGEAFLAVPLSWGDTLRAQLDTELPAAIDPASPGLGLSVLGPVLDEADTGTLGTDPDIGPTRDRRAYRTGVMSQLIAYINRDSVDSHVSGAALAGMHYVVVAYDPTVAAAGPLDLRITVQVLHSEDTAPLYSDVPGVYPPRADSRLVDGSSAQAPAPADDADGDDGSGAPVITGTTGFPWLPLAGVVVSVVVLGGLLEIAVRVRRRRRERRPGRHLR